MIDPHVHCRDGEQAFKETIAHVFEIAAKQGVSKIFDMPNTSPPILTREDVERRLRLVPKQRLSDYFLYVGVSANKAQLQEAVASYNRFQNVIGLKLFAGKSVGNLEVIQEDQQKQIYQTLSDLNYTSVLAVHCEKEKYIESALFNPKEPITHCRTRSKKAEIESIKDQIKFAKQTKFQGKLHVVHVTTPESVALIDAARDEINITCGVTPHHLLWTEERMNRSDGLLYKMNPPLRSKRDVNALRENLRKGKIDWIETDHAPHPIGEKLFGSYPSGFPSLYLYKDLVEKFLPKIGLSQPQIKKVTHQNIVDTYSDKPN